jgi:hypothetical protein
VWGVLIRKVNWDSKLLISLVIFCLLLLPEQHRASVKCSFRFSFLIFRQSVGLLGWGINLSQGLYLHTGQLKHRINVHTNIHAEGGIWTHYHSVWVSKDSSCLRLLSYHDRLTYNSGFKIIHPNLIYIQVIYCYSFLSCFRRRKGKAEIQVIAVNIQVATSISVLWMCTYI